MSENTYFLAPKPPAAVSDIKLRVEIKNNKPVDLLYLTDSFISLASEYKNYLHDRGKEYTVETRLYVREIHTGSIITDLIDLTPVGLALAQEFNTFVTFVEFAKNVYNYLTKKSPEKPKEFNKKELRNFNNIIDPVAKDNGGQLNIGTLNIHGHVYINSYALTTNEAQIAQNTIRNEIAKLETQKIAVHNQVVLYMHHAVNDPGLSGDKGIIESISDRPLKLIWDGDFKEQVINSDANFFSVSFLVDCEVHTVRGGQPIAYKILKIHSVIE